AAPAASPAPPPSPAPPARITPRRGAGLSVARAALSQELQSRWNLRARRARGRAKRAGSGDPAASPDGARGGEPLADLGVADRLGRRQPRGSPGRPEAGDRRQARRQQRGRGRQTRREEEGRRAEPLRQRVEAADAERARTEAERAPEDAERRRLDQQLSDDLPPCRADHAAEADLPAP